MEEIAAPGLCGTFSTRTPILIDRIEPEMLACPAFCDALMQVQAREQLAIFCRGGRGRKAAAANDA